MALGFREPERGRMDRAPVDTSGAAVQSAFPSARAATRFYVPFLLGINLVGMMQIISVSWVPTYLIRAYDAPLADVGFLLGNALLVRSEEHTSELQSLMRISYAVFCLKKKKHHTTRILHTATAVTL